MVPGMGTFVGGNAYRLCTSEPPFGGIDGGKRAPGRVTVLFVLDIGTGVLPIRGYCCWGLHKPGGNDIVTDCDAGDDDDVSGDRGGSVATGGATDAANVGTK